MLSCYQFIPHSALFSADTSTRSIASTVVSLVLPTLFILHTHCCVFMHFGELVCPLLYSTHQLAQANDAATNASKSVFYDETDK
jgi:hypothetical protein